MSASENEGSCSKDDDGDPPNLSIKLPKNSNLPRKSKPWNDDHLPVDILLLTVEDCEFLACYYYLRDPFKSYHKSFGFVYFGNMGDEEMPLKVALIKCSTDTLYPGASQTAAKNVVTQLRPKVTFSVGSCRGLNCEKAKLGDVVISSKLTTDAFKTPVSRDVCNLVRNAADGWEAPLENPEAREVKAHCDSEILSCPDPGSAEQQCKFHPGAIAVEMQGKGIFAAAHDMKSEYVLVKGVSHFADSSTHDSWKTFACVMAASLVSNILFDSCVFQQWPHYEEEDSSSNPNAKRIKLMPEPFDLKECQRQLQAIYSTRCKVKIIPWDSQSAIHITEVYTKLSWLKDDRKASGVTKERLEDYTDIFKADKHYPNPRRILVYGRPGIGKTVFTQKTTFDWSLQRNEVFRKFDLVLLTKLRDVCDLNDIRAILTASKLLAGDGMISVDSLCNYIQDNQEKVLLIFDGYDEYSCTEKHSPIRDIWEGTLLMDCYVIITTRELKSRELRSHSHVQFEISGFDSKDQIKKFARKLLEDEDVEEFLEALEEKDLKEIAKIPLLLSMLCIIWNNEGDRVGLPKSRANIYTNFIQTLLNHMNEKHTDSEQLQKVDDYREKLSQLGKLAFDALLRDCLFLHFSELPVDDPLITKLIEAGLLQILNLRSLNPEKGVFLIHKSIQEFLAAFYLKEELLKEQSTTCLSKIDSFEKIVKIIEVLKFTCELSAEAACAVLSHLGMIGKKEGLTEYEFSETPSEKEFTERQRQFVTVISHSLFCCAVEKRRDLYSMFLSFVGGVLLVNYDQLHSVANEHLLKSSAVPEYIFFEYSDKYSEQNLITVLEDVNAVIVSCSGGELKASEFLKKYPFRLVNDFFLKKEEKMTIYIGKVVYDSNGRFPTELLKELISSPESTQKNKKSVGDQSNEQDNRTALCLTDNNDSTTGQPRHCLSRVYEIDVDFITSQEMETLIEVLPFVSFPQWVSIRFAEGAPELVETFTETLVSRNFTNRLKSLTLINSNLTAKAAGVIARSLHQAPNLFWLELSHNPLSEGVSDLTRHLSDVPDLEELYLEDVKMTKKQVNDLTEAVRRSKISTLRSSYHDKKGNLKPEHKWPTEDYWKWRPWGIPGTLTDPEDELRSEASTKQEDELESEASTEQEDELESKASTEQEDKLESEASTEQEDELASGSSTETHDEQSL